MSKINAISLKNYFLSFTACSLKCQKCRSSISMKDCISNEKESDCPPEADKCSTMTYTNNVALGGSLYAKGCSYSSTCHASVACPDPGLCTVGRINT